MTKSNPKILIGTLYSGENELEECIDSLKNQSYENWNHQIFKNLPNKEAHETLYQYFMDNQKKYDLFIKLDADMVFISKYALSRIVELFSNNNKLDHVILGVSDWYSSLTLEGLHIFSNNVYWIKNDEKLNVDTQPIVPGKRRIYVHSLPPIAYHSPNPSKDQAFQFGIHRTLKAFRFNKKGLDLFQYKILVNCWKNYKHKKDIRNGLVLLGAEEALKNYRHNKAIEYKKISPSINIDNNTVFNLLYSKWNSSIYRLYRLVKYAGVKKIVSLYVVIIAKRIFKSCLSNSLNKY